MNRDAHFAEFSQNITNSAHTKNIGRDDFDGPNNLSQSSHQYPTFRVKNRKISLILVKFREMGIPRVVRRPYVVAKP